jgi:hypothetical protein
MEAKDIKERTAILNQWSQNQKQRVENQVRILHIMLTRIYFIYLHSILGFALFEKRTAQRDRRCSKRNHGNGGIFELFRKSNQIGIVRASGIIETGRGGETKSESRTATIAVR